MKSASIIQDYYGGLYFIENNSNKNLTIFVVDDNQVFLDLVKEELESNPQFNVLTFLTGEECLNYLGLKPDLVILDYHLDSLVRFAQNGDVIKSIIKDKLPCTEVIIVSSDHKLTFFQGLQQKNTLQKVMHKDGFILDKIKDQSIKMEKKKFNKSPFLLVVLVAVLLTLWISYFLE